MLIWPYRQTSVAIHCLLGIRFWMRMCQQFWRAYPCQSIEWSNSLNDTGAEDILAGRMIICHYMIEVIGGRIRRSAISE